MVVFFSLRGEDTTTQHPDICEETTRFAAQPCELVAQDVLPMLFGTLGLSVLA